MGTVSFDIALNRIENSKTKDNFLEVLNCYNNGNNRAAVVLLWSVIIADIVFKLQDLKLIHNDGVAKDILEKITQEQKRVPESPTWEKMMLDKVCERTELISPVAKSLLDSLKKSRDYCAHPILGQFQDLYRPTTEEVSCFIRVALEEILCKPPLFAGNIVDSMSESIKAFGSFCPSQEDKEPLRNFIEKHFARHFTDTQEKAIFRTFWKFVFFVENEDCIANREINSRVLEILFERDKEKQKSNIQNDSSFFCRLPYNEEQKLLFLTFVEKHPEILDCFSAETGELIRQALSSDINHFAKSPFLSESLEEHLKTLITLRREELSKIECSSVAFLISIYPDIVKIDSFLELCVCLYCSRQSFDDANECFDKIIKPHLKLFQQKHFELLLQESENYRERYPRQRYNQLLCRGRAGTDYDEILTEMRKRGITFCQESYPQISKIITENVDAKDSEY